MIAQHRRKRDDGDLSEAELFAWMDMSAGNDKESAAMKELLLKILSAAEAQCDRQDAATMAATR